MDKIISLCKRRGFIFPGSEIYGGLANTWDYGPLGVELKNNIKQEWWKRFVKDREDMVGIDAALLMNTKTYEASGHLEEFSDPLVECRVCHARHRADEIKDTCPKCGSKDFTDSINFNLMMKTWLGPSEDSASAVYFRPETAQGIFVNFKNILDTTRKKIPFGIAQIGKAFRNEITPGNFIFRTREFEQMEIEYFVKPGEWQKYFEIWHKEMNLWIHDLGIGKEQIVEIDVPAEERAHYSQKTIDFEYKFPFGQKELYGLAYRADFDLRNHKLEYTDVDGIKYIPHVIEPSLGVDRTILAVLLSAYHEEAGEEERIVLKFPAWLAPYKIAIFPLLKNKPELVSKAREIFNSLRVKYTCDFDDNGNVGKRYRRQDEIGTPYCLTVDFDTLEKGTITVRDRDTMQQETIKLNELENYLAERLK